MAIRLLTACIQAVAFLCGTSVLAQDVLDAAEFGLNKLEAGQDATPVFRRAIEACHDRGAKELKIPTGDWHLYPDYAFERTLAVANNNPGVKKVVFLLDQLKDFVLSGDGARFICHGQMLPVSADEADNLTLRGFSIDWAHPFNFQGEVVATHPDQNAFDLSVHEEVYFEMRGQRLVFLEKPSHRPQAWKDWAPPTAEEDGWEHNLQWNMWFDGKTTQPIPGEHQWALEPDARAEQIGPRVIRLYNAAALMPQVGWVVAVNGMGDPNRTSPAIRIAGSKDVLLEDVTIHHAGGMGVVMQRTDGATLRRVKVALPDGKSRIVTTTADATHFNGCRGHILLEECLFENMLDDATNVHGCFLRIEKQSGERTLICRRVHSQQLGLVVAQSGDKVRFVKSDNLQPYFDADVIKCEELNSDLCELTLDSLPEGGVQTPSCLYNTSWQPALTVRRCHVRNNRARIMLLATSGEVLVEDSVFENCSMAGIQLEGDSDFWYESGPTSNVLVRNNVFRGNAGAALRISPKIDVARYPNALYHGGLVFENNLIETFHRRVVEGAAIDGLTFRGNTIRLTHEMDDPDRKTASFSIASGKDIVIENNVFEGEGRLVIEVGAASSNTRLQGNRGIEEVR